MAIVRALKAQLESLRLPSQSFLCNLLLAASSLPLLYIQLAHHVLWRDELNAWASPTFSSLVHHIHLGGHPWLWYVILRDLSCFTESFLALKMLQAVIATGILVLVAFRSSFCIREKALILAGYFFVFESTVVIRTNGVLLLLLLFWLSERAAGHKSRFSARPFSG